MPHRASLVVSLAALVLALSRVAAAQSSDAEAALTRAREAQALANAGDVAGAVAGFKAAHALDPRPEYQCNIGIAYYKAADLPRAQLFLGRCLDRGSHLPGEFITVVREVLAEVEAALRAGDYTPVDLVVDPAGATVALSAFAPDETVVGARLVWLPFGTHTLTVTAPGHVTQTVDVTLSGRARQPVSVSLEMVVIEPVFADPGPPPDPRRPWFIGAGVMSGVAFGLGVYSLASWRGAVGEAERAGELPPGPDYNAKARSSERKEQRGKVMAGFAVAVAGLAGYLWYRGAAEERPVITPVIGADSAGVSLDVSF